MDISGGEFKILSVDNVFQILAAFFPINKSLAAADTLRRWSKLPKSINA